MLSSALKSPILRRSQNCLYQVNRLKYPLRTSTSSAQQQSVAAVRHSSSKMATPVQDNLVSKNKQYASSFDKGDLATPPAKKYTVVTCMDARIDPAAAYGIDLGDAHVIRNAGGSAKEALRSLVISEQLLGTNEILIIKHTGCGMVTFQNSDATGVVQKNLGQQAVDELQTAFGGDFLPFPDLNGAVKDDVEYLKASKLIPDSVAISGWVYDVKTGKVGQVV